MDNTTRENNREEKAKAIISNPNQQIQRIDDLHYKVKSQTYDKEYDVIHTEKGWICSCPDSVFSHMDCKHSLAVSLSIKIRNEAKERSKLVIEQVACDKCPKCQSVNIVKHGIRHNKRYDLQRYSCKDCKNRFSFNLGFEKMKVNPNVITSAIQLYFSGESLRKVQQFLRLQGVNVAHSTIYGWIKKYTDLMEEYLATIKPQVGNTWRADELFLKIKGNMKYLYALMDDETRFWIAQQISENKYKDDISQMLRDGKALTGKKPEVFITDGARNFHQAYNKEFRTQHNPRTKHIQHIHFRKDMNNNKMERLNGEIRDREKVVRGVKKMDSPLLKGSQIFHNYIRPHMALDGKTPGEVCGIKIEGKDKWITLIQNASK